VELVAGTDVDSRQGVGFRERQHRQTVKTDKLGDLVSPDNPTVGGMAEEHHRYACHSQPEPALIPLFRQDGSGERVRGLSPN
jgi:hypothetical protein